MGLLRKLTSPNNAYSTPTSKYTIPYYTILYNTIKISIFRFSISMLMLAVWICAFSWIRFTNIVRLILTIAVSFSGACQRHHSCPPYQLQQGALKYHSIQYHTILYFPFWCIACGAYCLYCKHVKYTDFFTLNSYA